MANLEAAVRMTACSIRTLVRHFWRKASYESRNSSRGRKPTRLVSSFSAILTGAASGKTGAGCSTRRKVRSTQERGSPRALQSERSSKRSSPMRSKASSVNFWTDNRRRPWGDRPQTLVTLPNAQAWEVPARGWHLDLPRLSEAVTPGVQVFTFLDSVQPEGGGTLVVAGSHELLNTGEIIRSQDVKSLLRERYEYFRTLFFGGHVAIRRRPTRIPQGRAVPRICRPERTSESA